MTVLLFWRLPVLIAFFRTSHSLLSRTGCPNGLGSNQQGHQLSVQELYLVELCPKDLTARTQRALAKKNPEDGPEPEWALVGRRNKSWNRQFRCWNRFHKLSFYKTQLSMINISKSGQVSELKHFASLHGLVPIRLDLVRSCRSVAVERNLPTAELSRNK